MSRLDPVQRADPEAVPAAAKPMLCVDCREGRHGCQSAPCTCACKAIEWANPPQAKAGIAAALDPLLLAALRAHPGKWAKARQYKAGNGASSAASSIRGGKTKLGPGRWEATGRRNPDGTSTLYLRYLDESAAVSA